MKLWKVRKVFGDLVYDLRSRGLLPVVILLVVAMIAVPMLISRGGSSSSSGPLQPTSATGKTAPEAEQAVVSYSPAGLRNYKSRLDRLSPKDPFRQPEVPAVSAAAASQLTSGVAPPTVSSSSSSSSVAPSTGASTGVSTGSTRTTTTHRLYLYRSVADISVGDVSQPLQRHKHIPAFSSLPDQVTPVMIYLGSSLDRKRAYFSISKSAAQPTGQGTCVPSPTDCSLLSLAVGQSADMVYSTDGKTYRVKVNKINLNRVPLHG
ncbi:MAG: hypothetical protein ACJ75Z_02675 [Solirubrobacterales bacterium]